jgi:hypothetical protein
MHVITRKLLNTVETKLAIPEIPVNTIIRLSIEAAM